MPDLYLYVLPVPRSGQDRSTTAGQRSIAAQSLLGGGGAVETIAAEPGEATLEWQYRGTYAGKLAAEVRELATAGGIEHVPLAGRDESTPRDGYYALTSDDVERLDPRVDDYHQVRLRLRNKGSRASHWRATETALRQADHGFGNDLGARVAIPDAATKRRWYDPETGALAPATTQTTRSAELGAVALLDPEEPEWSDPTVVYELPYAREGETDVRVWDTRGESARLDGDGLVQWQKVFDADHDIDSPLVVSNGLYRVTLDEAAGSITAETYDAAADAWATVGLSNSSDWALVDIDITQLALADVRAQLTFAHPTDGRYALDVSCQRGRETLLVERPTRADSAIPSGLVDWLAPIAADWLIDVQPSKTLVPRREVRR